MHVDDVPDAVEFVSIMVVDVPVVDQEVVIRIRMDVQRPDRCQHGSDGQQGTKYDEGATHRWISLRRHRCGAKKAPADWPGQCSSTSLLCVLPSGEAMSSTSTALPFFTAGMAE